MKLIFYFSRMKFILLFIFTTLIFLCNAQSPDTLSTHITKENLRFSILIGGQITAGNYQNYGVNSTFEIHGQSRNHLWDITPSFRFTELMSNHNWIKKEEEFYSNQAYYLKFNNKWKFLSFSEIEHSLLRKTLFRGDIGIGIGYNVIKDKRVQFEITEVVLPDVYISSDTFGGYSIIKRPANNFTLRSSTRCKLVLNFPPFTLSSSNLIQPEVCGWQISDGHIISQKDNINIRSTNTIDIMIKKGLSVGGKVDIIYQSYPNFITENQSLVIKPYDVVTTIYLKYLIR